MVEPFLEVRNLRLNYGKQLVLNDVSFSLYAGRVTALIGPNGAGKSSVMRILSGLVKPDGGAIYILGNPVSANTQIHNTTGFFIEGPDFYKNLSARQNLRLLQKIRNDRQSADELIEKVGLSEAANKKVGKFSRGMKQRLGVAQALLGHPSILVLDEPFNGLDPEVKQFLMQLIRELASEKNMAILISSHILADLETLADDFILIREGKIHLSGKLTDFRNERHQVTFRFETEPNENLLQQLIPGHLTNQNPWYWATNLTIIETTNAVKTLVEHDCIPSEIQRADLLHSKYMEIVK
jgi:ABC-2 type transport system ATP-binding protein